jgi:hypothetical protein
VVWFIVLCIILVVCQHFQRMYCLHHQDWSEEFWEVNGLYEGHSTGIGQSQQWDGNGRCSHLWASRKEHSSGHWKGLFCIIVKCGSLLWRKNVSYKYLKNKMLKEAIGLTRDKLSEKFGVLRINELYMIYRSYSVIRIVKCRGLWWSGHACRMRKINLYRILVGKLLENSHLIGWEGDVRVTLRWMSGR